MRFCFMKMRAVSGVSYRSSRMEYDHLQRDHRRLSMRTLFVYDHCRRMNEAVDFLKKYGRCDTDYLSKICLPIFRSRL